MNDVQYYKEIFDRYGGMMRTTQLANDFSIGYYQFTTFQRSDVI